MTLSFVVVFIVLAKYGFPVILRAIDSRKEYIDNSLDAAREAESRLAQIRTESQAMLDAAENERTDILHKAAEARDQLIGDARKKAETERARIIDEARKQADVERQDILRDARRQIAVLSVAITEKMLRHNLPDEASQTALAEQLLDEMQQRDKKN
jgi:ATP synthase F0, B subunit